MKKTIVYICIIFLLASIIIPNVNSSSSHNLYVTFSTNPTIASPGTNGYLELNIESIGTSTVSDIEIVIDNWDSSVIQPKGNWEVSVGDIDGGDSLSVLYEFIISENAIPGLYQLIFEISSSEVETIRQTAMIKIEDTAILDIVSVSPSSINIGEVTTVVFNVTNQGGSTSGNIIFSWEDPNDLILPVGSDNRIAVPSFNAIRYAEIPVNIMASPSIVAGVYPLTITMEFYDRTGSLQTITSYVGLQIGGGTDFEVVLQQSTTSGTTFAISNTGANVASSVIVSIPQQTNYVSSGTSSVSLGNLDAGDYTLASFQISSSSVNQNITERPFGNRNPGELPEDFSQNMPEDFDSSMFGNFQNRSFMGNNGNTLTIEIAYTDLFGVRQTVQKEVALSGMSSSISTSNTDSQFGDMNGFRMPGGQSQESENGTTYIIIGAAGIIIIFAILRIGKKKNIPYISKKLKGRKNENN